jgi:hypothetical protein
MFATVIGGTLLEPLFPCELNENADGVRTLFWSPDIVYSPPDVSATRLPTSIRWRISFTCRPA